MKYIAIAGIIGVTVLGVFGIMAQQEVKLAELRLAQTEAECGQKTMSNRILDGWGLEHRRESIPDRFKTPADHFNELRSN